MKRYSLRTFLAVILLLSLFAIFAGIGKARNDARDRLVDTGFRLAHDRASDFQRGRLPAAGGWVAPIPFDKTNGELIDQPNRQLWLKAVWLEQLPNPITFLAAERLVIDKEHFPGMVDSDFAPAARLNQLEEILVPNNSLTDASVRLIGNFKNLEVLDISGNEISDAGLKHLSRLHRLRELYLSDTEITDQGLQHLKDLPNLEILELSGTSVTGEPLAEFKSAPQWQRLDLTACEQLTPQSLRCLKQNRDIKELCLSITPINNETASFMKHLSGLEVLSVCSTNIGDRFINDLKRLKIRHLDINNTQVTDVSIENIVQMEPIEYFSCYDARLSESGEVALQDRLDELAERLSNDE